MTAQAFDKDGWLKSGDIVYRDENYNFFYVDRQKLLLKYRNHQVIFHMINFQTKYLIEDRKIIKRHSIKNGKIKSTHKVIDIRLSLKRNY